MQYRDWSNLPLLMSVKQTADVIGYGQARIRELCRTRQIPHIKLGRAYKIPKEALKSWLFEEVLTGGNTTQPEPDKSK